MTDEPAVNAALHEPQEGWRAVDDVGIHRITSSSFVSGDPRSDRIRVAYFHRPADLAVVGRAWFGPGAEGPPRHAHGGSMAALLDEVMGFSCWMKGHRVLAKKIEISFLRSLPLHSVVTFEGSVVVVDGRNISARGALVLPSGVLCAEGTGLFVEIPAARLARMISGE